MASVLVGTINQRLFPNLKNNSMASSVRCPQHFNFVSRKKTPDINIFKNSSSY